MQADPSRVERAQDDHPRKLRSSPTMPRELPAAAKQYRAAMWFFVLIALAVAVLAVQGIRRIIPAPIGFAAGAVSSIAFFLAARFGWRVREAIVAERERVAAHLSLVMLAGVLKDRTDAELEALGEKEGATAEAARMVLQRRRDDAARRAPGAR